MMSWMRNGMLVVGTAALARVAAGCTSSSPPDAPSTVDAAPSSSADDLDGSPANGDGAPDAAPLPLDRAEACAASDGTVVIRPCCAGEPDFSDTCAPGFCGCSSENSTDKKTCSCPGEKCWNGSTCAERKKTPPPTFDAIKCQSFCAGIATPSCARTTGGSSEVGTAVVSTKAGGCLVDVTIAGSSTRLRLDCSAAKVCLVSGASETCQPATNSGVDVLYSSGGTTIACLR